MVDGSESPAIAPSDGVLVARVRRGDAAAFGELVARHYQSCLRYAVRFLGTREDAEDAVQETWLRAHRGLATYREQDVFERWLFRILLNVCRNVAVSRRRLEQRFVLGGDAGGALDAVAAPVAELGAGQTIEAVLRPLDPRTREALLLKYGLGLDYNEMALRTGDRVSALKMRVKRGLAALKVLQAPEREP